MFFSSSACHRDLHSFPTRRSSDLVSKETLATRIPWLPLLLLLCILPLCFLGFGTDNDTYAVLDCGYGTWHLHMPADRKSTRLNSSHPSISYAVFCLKKKKILSNPH